MPMKDTAKAKKLRKKIDGLIRSQSSPSCVALYRDQADALGVVNGEMYLHTGLPVKVVMKP